MFVYVCLLLLHRTKKKKRQDQRTPKRRNRQMHNCEHKTSKSFFAVVCARVFSLEKKSGVISAFRERKQKSTSFFFLISSSAAQTSLFFFYQRTTLPSSWRFFACVLTTSSPLFFCCCYCFLLNVPEDSYGVRRSFLWEILTELAPCCAILPREPTRTHRRTAVKTKELQEELGHRRRAEGPV